MLQESGLSVEHSFIYEFQDNGQELYGVDPCNLTTSKTAFYVVQRIISTLAGIQGGTSLVTLNSVANGDWADVKAYAYQGSINKTASRYRVRYWYMACGAEQTEEEWTRRPRLAAFFVQYVR